MNRQTLANELYNNFITNLPTISMSGASMTKDTPDWLYCDECGLELDIAENKYGETVVQRVRTCRSCKKIDLGDGVWKKGSVV